VEGSFDRVVSVGMLEHVGIDQLPAYFLTVRDRLSADGVALIHSVSRRGPPGVTGPFIRKHIFPGGYSPALSETMAAVETSGLWTLDIEIWRLHYAETLRAWRQRFFAAQDQLPARYDARFRRMWDFYLAGCEGSFRYGGATVFQLQLGAARDAAPLTRDYIDRAKAALLAREADALPGLLASTDAAFNAGRGDAGR